MAKARLLSLLLIVCLVVISFNLLSIPNATATGANWLTGWGYRKSHVVANSTGAGTNYPVFFTVINGSAADSGGTVYINNKTRSDFGDVRFTDDDGSTLLDYYLETLNTGANATFWVEVSDSLESAAQTIYVYYGKADATTTSSGANTFLFFDDFSANTIGSYTQNGGTWSINTGLQELQVTGAQCYPGYGTVGTAGYAAIDSKIVGSNFAYLGSGGSVTSITASLRLSNMGDASYVDISAAIYKHSDSTIVAATPATRYFGTFVQAWKTFVFTSPPSFVATEYVLVVLATSDFSVDPPTTRLYYDAGTANQGHYNASTSFPATASFSHDNNKYSIYCFGSGLGNSIIAPTTQSPPASYAIEVTAKQTHLDQGAYLEGILGFQTVVASSNTGYTMAYWNSVDDYIGITLFVGSGLAETVITFAEGTFYKVKGYFKNGSLKAEFQDGTTATSTNTSYTSGYFGLRTSAASGSFKVLFVRGYVSPEPIHGAWGAEESIPAIGTPSGTNWDDTDNCYAQKKTYTVSVTYSDVNGFAHIHYCELYLKTGGNTTRAEFQFHEDDNSWSTPAGSTEWTLVGYSNSSSGNNIAVIWGFQAQWDAVEESNLDFLFFVIDSAGGWTNSVSAQAFDVVTRLVTSGFTSDDPRINLGGTTTISGTVYYGNDPGSNTASASYPPDAEFTSVSIHDSTHAVQATDVTIVNGALSVSFAIPSAVQSNTYHVYINLADADGTDQDALDGDTTVVAGDRIKVNAATLAFEDPDGRVNVGVAGIFSCTAQSELDGHVLGAGDSLVLTGYTFTYNGTYWVNSTSPAAPTSVTINSLTSVNEATFGITAGNINANSATGKWDRIRIDSLACVDTRIDISTEGLFYCTATLETDGHALGAGDSLTLTGHVFAWNVTSVRFEYKETNLTVTNTTINSFTSGNEANFGITVGNINSMTATEVWDRYAVDAASLTFSDLDGRTNVGIVESFSCTVQSEYYDHHVLNGVGDLLTLGGHAFTYNGTHWVYSTSLATPDNITINTLTSVYEATFGISAGNINGNSAVEIWDNLTVTNIQPVQYLGSGDYKYEAQLKYGYDLALISGGYVDLAYPNGTVVGASSSNATGWVTFVVGQLNSTSGAFNLYGENETAYAITCPGANQTFTIRLWTLAPKDVSGNSLTSTTQTVTNVGTAVWTGTSTVLYIPLADFNVSVSWLQNLIVNSTLNVTIAGDTTTDFNCTCFPYVIGATRYWAASNATITSSSYAASLLTVQFSCVNDSYVLVSSYTTRPCYVLNVTYDYTTAFAPGYLVMPHFGNATIVASYENWAGLYVKKTDHVMTSIGWAGQRLDIVTNGTVGDSGELDMYCAVRGPPAATSGFTVTSYVGGVFVGLYTFASPHTASLEWAVASSGGPSGGPTQAASLFITLAFTFPKTVQSGATVDGFLNVSWMGAAKVYIWSVVVDSDYAKDWELQITGLPWTLETLMQNGQTQVPVVLYVTGTLTAGDYSIPCDVTFQTVEGVSKTVRSILTFEVVTPIAQVPSTLVYVFLIGISLVVTSGLFLGTQKRRKYSQ